MIKTSNSYIVAGIFFFIWTFLNMPLVCAETESLGPLNITNNFPTTLLFFNYTPEATYTVKKNEVVTRIGITESNTIIKEKNGSSEALIDVELTRFHLNFFTGITDRIETGIEIPFLYYHKGFMDTPIEWTESRIGKGSRARKAVPRNDIRFLLIKDGETVYDINTGIFGLGDITLKFKYAFLESSERFPDISIKFDLKLPTANEEKALGSGGLDFGPTLLLHKSYKKLHFQLHLGYFSFHDMELEKRNLKIHTNSFFHGILAMEYPMKTVSWILQFSANSNPFERFGMEDVNSPGQAISVGFKYPFLKQWMLQFAFTENISSVAYPDFSGDFIIEYRFGGK